MKLRALHMRLVAPMMYLGAAPIHARFGADQTLRSYMATSTLPTPSMLSGLVANALGYHRRQRKDLYSLQEAMHYGAAVVSLGDHRVRSVRDFQTAQLGADDAGWTTRREPEGRRGGKEGYEYPYIRLAHYLANISVEVVLTLDHPTVSLGMIADALQRPARPLFIGRKSCLPEEPIFQKLLEIDDVPTWVRDFRGAPSAFSARGHVIARAWDARCGGVAPREVELATRGPSGVHTSDRRFLLDAPTEFPTSVSE